jgi:alpha-glucosidase
MRAVDAQKFNPESVLNTYRRFIKWRKSHPALVLGTMQILESQPPLFAFLRTWERRRILLVFNLSNQPAIWKLNGAWREVNDHGVKSARNVDGQLNFEGLDMFAGYQDG